MRAHRTIWGIAAAFAVLAGLAIFFRQLPDSTATVPTPARISADERDRLVEEMTTALQRDWRVRRSSTQGLVEAVAVYAQHPDLHTAETHFALGLLRHYGRNDLEGAESAYRRAQEMAPEWAWPWVKLGVLLYVQGDTRGGLHAMEKAMALRPEWSRPHSDLAILYRLDGDLNRALTEVRKALDLEPNDPVTRYNYGVVLDYSGRLHEAREQYLRVVEMDPLLPAPHYNLACGYAKEGDIEKALDYLAASMELDPAFHPEALSDPDFDGIRKSPEFFQLMVDHSPR